MLSFFGVEVQFSKEVPVTDGMEGEFVVFIQTLQICFDQRMQASHLCSHDGFAADDSINDLVDRYRIRWSGRGRDGRDWSCGRLVLLREHESGTGKRDNQDEQ